MIVFVFVSNIFFPLFSINVNMGYYMIQQLSKIMKKTFPFFDIAANLTDEQFGKTNHHLCDR